jgi:hypothetical protein
MAKPAFIYAFDNLGPERWTFTQKFGLGGIVKFDHLKDLSQAYLEEVHSGKTIYTQAQVPGGAGTVTGR